MRKLLLAGVIAPLITGCISTVERTGHNSYMTPLAERAGIKTANAYCQSKGHEYAHVYNYIFDTNFSCLNGQEQYVEPSQRLDLHVYDGHSLSAE